MTARVLLTSVAALCLFHGSSWAVHENALVLYLDFEEGAGDTAMDGSEHGNNGTVHMAEWAAGKYGKGDLFERRGRRMGGGAGRAFA